jgi:DNA-binding response OmpR family regulator
MGFLGQITQLLFSGSRILKSVMRILVVEDERKIAGAIKRGLEQEAFAVDVTYDGEEGLASATGDNYDLIILDRMLPGGMDGIEIVAEIRKEKKHMPILLLTAKDKVRDRVDGLDAGADDYLVKPFAFEELLSRIRALLRRPHQTLQTVLQADDLTLNPVTFEVMRHGQPIQLTQKEFGLLEYLLRNPNRILTKDAITQHVWDYDADILPNTVEVYIGYLRNKIDKPFKNRPALIHTIRGFGYKLVVDERRT